MAKLVRFTDSNEDKNLIAEIEDYRKAHGLPSFISTVRKLCRDAMAVAKIQH